jgi:flagellin-like protein
MRQNKRGVSAMVATILLVAITVVLAALLYIMVSGVVSSSTGPRPIALELTVQGQATTSSNGETWVNFSLDPSQAVTTAEFGFVLLSTGGTPIPAGAGSCPSMGPSCSPGAGWIAFLWTPQGKVVNVWSSTGWSNSTLTVLSSMTLGLVAAASLHVAGSGDILKVASSAQPTVVGQSQPL